MSADTPESIPTSRDRSSHRPTKRRALTPVSQQAATLDSLFSRPDQEIRVPPPAGSSVVARRAVPEIVTNVQGSSAGAGSGEFHVYKASRRREYERLREMDEEVAREKEKEDFEREKREREDMDAEKTRRNREKRAKKRNKGKGAGAGAGEKKGEGLGKIQPRKEGNGRDGEGNGDGGDVMNGGEGKEVGASSNGTDGPGLVIHDDD